MTLRDFNELSWTQKKEVIELWGELISENTIHGYLVKLLEVHHFYVEVYCDPRDGMIKRYRASHKPETVYYS